MDVETARQKATEEEATTEKEGLEEEAAAKLAEQRELQKGSSDQLMSEEE